MQKLPNLFATMSSTTLLASACASPTRVDLDAEVRRLCAVDGGIKIYEAVKLPPDKFDDYGQINFFRPTQGESALGPEYLFNRETTYYRKGNPELWRTHYVIARRSDNKVLGELIEYSRRGGDLPGPWHESSFGCPDPKGGAGECATGRGIRQMSPNRSPR